ncbi:MerR family transcriptional regulator [Corynebacterium sp. H127]|uniref:MerR family transcriptional regulator n=1 Tax=Corynebacterium sp. H127 TaxID=3133418 RepID=UPI0030A66FD9
MRIKELATTVGTTVRTVRHYHQVGLLPIPRGTPREYTFEHLVRLTRIRHLDDSGLSLAQVRKLIEPTSVNIHEELAATKTAIDEQIAVLQQQRQRIDELLERSNAVAPSAIPLPQRVTNFYVKLLAREESPELRKVIHREQRMVEVLSHLGFLDSLEYLWLEQPSDEYIEVALRMFRSFHSISSMSPEEAEQEIDAMMAEHIRESGFKPQDMPEIFERFFAVPGAFQLLTLAYPHPNQKLYISKFIDTYLGGHSGHH